MDFSLLCMGMIAILFGLTLAFMGYKLMWVVLPIFGFFFGFVLGAQTLQALFGTGFLATISGWIVGFVVGAIFAVLSYLFYFLAVAILSGAAGYGLAVGLLGAIGLDLNWLVWIIGIIAGIALAVIVLRFNLQKWAVIIITAVAGTSIIIYALVGGFGNVPSETMLANPVLTALQNSWLWVIFFLVVAGAAIWFQFATNRAYDVEEWNNYTLYVVE